jgi:hypothetical protein
MILKGVQVEGLQANRSDIINMLEQIFGPIKTDFAGIFILEN